MTAPAAATPVTPAAGAQDRSARFRGRRALPEPSSGAAVAAAPGARVEPAAIPDPPPAPHQDRERSETVTFQVRYDDVVGDIATFPEITLVVLGGEDIVDVVMALREGPPGARELAARIVDRLDRAHRHDVLAQLGSWAGGS